MPLRDHFHSPINDRFSWDGFHGMWPAMLVIALSKRLPDGYIASPTVHLGSQFEIDIAAFDENEPLSWDPNDASDGGGVATAVWAPPIPSLSVATASPEMAEYEVRIYDTDRGRQLVAAVEIVSPANKDRPETRRAFVAKCAALLNSQVSVAIVDVVTTREVNLYAELLEAVGQHDPSLGSEPVPLYATECRWVKRQKSWFFETWANTLKLGEPLPTVPLWLDDNLAVPLELESTYEETCRVLRIR